MQAGNAHYRQRKDVPDIVPVFPLSGALLLPGGQLPLNIFEPRYLEMVDAAIRENREPYSSVAQVLPCYEVLHDCERQLAQA